MCQRFYIYLAAVSTLAFTSNAYAADVSCVMGFIDKEAAVVIKVQDEIGEFISSTTPELREVTSLYTQQSKLAKQRRVARVGWLLDVHPQRFTRPDELYALAWSEKDNQAWIDAAPEHKELNYQSDKFSAKLTEHPNKDALKQFFQANMRKSPLLELFESSGEAIKKIREEVKSCF